MQSCYTAVQRGISVSSLETPKGETLYAIQWGEQRPWRCRVRPADTLHLLALSTYAAVLLAAVLLLVSSYALMHVYL